MPNQESKPYGKRRIEKRFRTELKTRNRTNIKELLKNLHPADIAELCNELDAEEARFVYLLLDNETAADVLIEMDEDVRKRFSGTSSFGNHCQTFL